MSHRLTTATLDTEADLRALLGEPQPIVVSKIIDRLNAATRRFVEQAPFVCLATSNAAGDCDVSPRGDPPGFVRILDERTLLVPERPGNRIADSLRNILACHARAVKLLLLLVAVCGTAAAEPVTTELPASAIHDLIGCWRRPGAQETFRAKGAHGLEVVREVADRAYAERARLPRDVMYDPKVGTFGFAAAGRIHALLFLFQRKGDQLVGDVTDRHPRKSTEPPDRSEAIGGSIGS